MEKLKHRNHRRSSAWNLLLLSIAFLFIFSAYGALEVVQSSLNAEVGVISLCAIYGSYTVFSMLLPPLVLNNLGSRKSIAVSVIPYAAYIAAHFHPRLWTLVPAGILVGASAPVLWVAQRVYVTNLAFTTSGNAGKKTEKTVGYFHSIFYAIYSARGIGYIIMSILLSQESASTQIEDALSNTSTVPPSYTTTVFNATSSNETLAILCGDSASKNWEFTDSSDTNQGLDIDIKMLHILLSVYIGFIALGLVILFCIDDVPNVRETMKQIEESNQSLAIDDNNQDKQPDMEPSDSLQNDTKRRPKSNKTLVSIIIR